MIRDRCNIFGDDESIHTKIGRKKYASCAYDVIGMRGDLSHRKNGSLDYKNLPRLCTGTGKSTRVSKDLQSTTRLAESWTLQIFDTKRLEKRIFYRVMVRIGKVEPEG